MPPGWPRAARLAWSRNWVTMARAIWTSWGLVRFWKMGILTGLRPGLQPAGEPAGQVTRLLSVAGRTTTRVRSPFLSAAVSAAWVPKLGFSPDRFLRLSTICLLAAL